MSERHDAQRKRQIMLRFEHELDRYLSGEIDEIRLERRGKDPADHFVTNRNAGYKELRHAA